MLGASVNRRMESTTVILREKRGCKWEYRDIEIPTDAEMERVALELHSAGGPSLTEVLRWRVLYLPALPIRYTAEEVDPFEARRIGPPELHKSKTVSYCTFGYEQEWGVTFSWANGEDQPPVKCNAHGDVLPYHPSLSQQALFSETVAQEELIEGTLKRIEENSYERNRQARSQCIGHHGQSCVICGFDFGKVYGDFVNGFIHVHHLRPISISGGPHQVDPVADLRPVCANCHAAIHACEPPLEVEELRERMQKKINARN